MAKDVKYFSNCFIKECGKGNVNLSHNYSNINVYFMVRSIPDSTLKNEIDNESIIENEGFKRVNFKLLNTNENSFNKDTLEESGHTYQEMRNESAIEYIFNKDADNKIKNSVDFDAAKNFYNNKAVATDEKTPDKSKYLALTSEYDLNHGTGTNIKDSNYRSSEFFRLGIKEDYVIENELCLKCDDFQYFENHIVGKDNTIESNLSTGVYGFLLTYKKADNTEIPMMVYKFAKPTYSNYGKIKFAFNANGLFGVV